MIKKRGNRWWVLVYAGRDPLTGRKRQKTRTAASKAEARQLEARLISQVSTGQHGGAAGKTVADLIEAWFQWRPSVRPISPNTLVNYRRYADQKLLPALGRLPLNRVDTATIDRFYAELRQRGSKCQHCYRRMRDGQPPMRPGEVFRLRFSGEERIPDRLRAGRPHDPKRHPRRPCGAVGRLQAGHGLGLDQPQPGPADHPASGRAARHPAARGRPGRAAHRDGHGRGPGAGPVPGPGRGAGRPPRRAVQPALVGCRLRPGRCPGRRRRDHPPWPAAAGPRRDQHADKRRVAVGAGTLALLRARRVEQAKAALATGVAFGPEAYVFSRAPDGSRPIRPDGVSHRFAELAGRLGINCRLHDLRHFMVTQLISAGVDVRTVSGRAGHRDGRRTTLGTYEAAACRDKLEALRVKYGL